MLLSLRLLASERRASEIQRKHEPNNERVQGGQYAPESFQVVFFPDFLVEHVDDDAAGVDDQPVGGRVVSALDRRGDARRDLLATLLELVEDGRGNHVDRLMGRGRGDDHVVREGAAVHDVDDGDVLCVGFDENLCDIVGAAEDALVLEVQGPVVFGRHGRLHRGGRLGDGGVHGTRALELDDLLAGRDSGAEVLRDGLHAGVFVLLAELVEDASDKGGLVASCVSADGREDVAECVDFEPVDRRFIDFLLRRRRRRRRDETVEGAEDHVAHALRDALLLFVAFNHGSHLRIELPKLFKGRHGERRGRRRGGV